jgi:hypothetical protein
MRHTAEPIVPDCRTDNKPYHALRSSNRHSTESGGAGCDDTGFFSTLEDAITGILAEHEEGEDEEQQHGTGAHGWMVVLDKADKAYAYMVSLVIGMVQS